MRSHIYWQKMGKRCRTHLSFGPQGPQVAWCAGVPLFSVFSNLLTSFGWPCGLTWHVIMQNPPLQVMMQHFSWQIQLWKVSCPPPPMFGGKLAGVIKLSEAWLADHSFANLPGPATTEPLYMQSWLLYWAACYLWYPLYLIYRVTPCLL